uniref:Protein fem-1 homolog B n=1 Tax=Glossina brevipalpis TaxID=37001 RepID=A0A1A9WWI7_9MUSC
MSSDIYRNRIRWFNSAWPGAEFWKGSSTTPLSSYITYPAKFDEVDGQSLTPLTMAAIAGNVSYVKTLLAQYDIDMEKECNVVFDGLVVYGASALWVASGLGHLQVVKLLVQKGADVNHNTKAQSSPLRAACYAGRLDIVKYLIDHGADINLGNKYNNTCIMIAAYKGHEHVVYTLLKNGANPNDQALCGATALHYAAECGHLEVCRLLLDHGACLLANEHGLTPVLSAAERTHEQLVDFFIERPGLMKEDEVIINSLELLGASFANDKDNYNIEKAFQHLMRAMEMRYSETDRVLRKQCVPPVTAYDEWFETQNIQELQAIRLNHHSIHMEALTIRERILGRNNPDLPQPIIYRGAVMADHGRFAQCQVLWNYAMDLRIMTNVPVERDLLRFAQLFSQIIRLENENLSLDQVLSVLVKCQQEIERNNKKINNPGPKDVPQMIADHNEQNITTALYLIKIITKILPKQVQINKSQIDLLYSTIKKFIKSDTRMADGQTLLHLAVNGITPVDLFYTNDVCKFPCLRTTVLLVYLGASVMSIDNERNTPLHTLVSKLPRDNSSLTQGGKCLKVLVEAGAHLDAVNAQGLTPAQLCKHGVLNRLLLNYQNSLTSLKCLASRCVVANGVPYKGLVPKILEPYIQIHSSDKFKV